MWWCFWFHRKWWKGKTYWRTDDDGTIEVVKKIAECEKCGWEWVRPMWENDNDRRRM